MLALVNRLLPRAAGAGDAAVGLDLQRASGASALHVATSLGRAAARRPLPPARPTSFHPPSPPRSRRAILHVYMDLPCIRGSPRAGTVEAIYEEQRRWVDEELERRHALRAVRA